VITYGSGADANLVVERQDRNGNRTTMAHDASGRVVETTQAAGSPEAITEICTYVPGTDLKATCTRSGETVVYAYDHALRRVSTTVQPRFGTTLTSTVAFDTMSRALVRADPYGRRTFTVYDVNDRPVRQVQERIPGGYAGATDQATLASLVRPTSANPAYTITDTVFDAEGQTVASVD